MPRRFAPRLPTLIFRNVILGGEGGIRTLDTVLTPYSGLANRRTRPLCDLSFYPLNIVYFSHLLKCPHIILTRLSVTSHNLYNICMSKTTKKLLEKFAEHANWNTPDLPQDDKKFFDFVIFAYKNGEQNISLDEFLDVINTKIPPTEDLKLKKKILASQIYIHTKYADGIKILSKFQTRKTAPRQAKGGF